MGKAGEKTTYNRNAALDESAVRDHQATQKLSWPNYTGTDHTTYSHTRVRLVSFGETDKY